MAATLQSWQKRMYTDSLTVYRADERDTDAYGNIAGVRLAVSGELCKKHDTDNYDAPISPAGQSKQNNIMTSDKLDCHISIDLRSEDLVYVQSADGRAEWFTVKGSPKHRPILNYQKAYLTTTVPPKIHAGAWNG